MLYLSEVFLSELYFFCLLSLSLHHTVLPFVLSLHFYQLVDYLTTTRLFYCSIIRSFLLVLFLLFSLCILLLHCIFLLLQFLLFSSLLSFDLCHSNFLVNLLVFILFLHLRIGVYVNRHLTHQGGGTPTPTLPHYEKDLMWDRFCRSLCGVWTRGAFRCSP